MENWSWDQNSMENWSWDQIKIPWKTGPGPKFLVSMQTAEQQTIATDLMLAMSSADYSLLLLFLTVVYSLIIQIKYIV